MRYVSPFLLSLSALAACTPFPELSETAATEVEPSEYLPLVPFDQLQVTLPQNNVTEDATLARGDALQNRATALRDTVIDPETRTRMARGVPGG